MSRVLVAFASSYGQTRKIAETIAAQLRHAGHTVELADARGERVPPARGYDGVVLGSRVQMGTHARELVEYIVRNREDLARIPTGFFSVCMASTTAKAGADPEGYIERTLAVCSWRPQRTRSFAGALAYRRYNLLLRFVMKQISRASGHPTDTSRDHDCTDWDAVVDFADELAGDIAGDGLDHVDAPMTAPLPSAMA